MEIAYLRVSTSDQSVASQRAAVEKTLGHEPDREYIDEGVSGRVMQRAGLDACLDALRPGDTLVIYSLSRLGRSAAAIIRLVQELTAPAEQGGRGVTLRSVTESLDSSTPTGRAFIGVMAVINELQAEIIRESTRAGLESARARGRVGGAKKRLTPAQARSILRAYEAGERMPDIAEEYAISIRSAWRYLAQAKASRAKVQGAAA